MNPYPPLPRRAALAALVCAAVLVACGGGIEADDDHDHDAVTLDTAGRLVTTEHNATALRVHDLDSNTVEATRQADNVPSALYASPGGRYALVMQRTQGLVQFVDGGIWQEDHGDHLHDYKQASKAVPWKLSGVRPTHYDVQAGKQAAIFMDGNATTTPAQSAGVRLITEASIAAGGTAASLDLGFPIHGLAEPVDNKLLAVTRAADASDALPTHLTLHQREGASYRLDRQLATRCSGMHGSASSGAYTVVGCVDGMLLVRHLSATTVDDGTQLGTALRVGALAGHARAPGHFVGIATEGTAPGPVTTRFHAVNGEAGAVANFAPQGWDTGRVRRAHGFDRSGQRLFIVADQGTLITAQRQGGAWANLARVTGAIPTMPTAAPWPVLTANGARDEVYITDPVAKQLVVVNSFTGAVLARRDLGFTPSNAVWIGITR
ncbi:MAG: hypothetical protein Q8M01_20860 [Rubrivivax sp.]|nr:hypothetical protein [Rubrivivax sp.]